MKYLYDAKAVGKRIKDIRKGRITQEALAEKLFLSVDSVANFENGRSVCMPEHVARICELFNVSSDFIYYGVSDKTESISDKYRPIFDLLEECEDEDLQRIEQIVRMYLRK